MSGRHTHPLLTTSVGSSFFGRLRPVEKVLVNEHADLDVAPKDSLIALRNHYPGNVTSLDQIYRQRHRHRRSKRGPRTDIQELHRLVQSLNYLCWSRKIEGSDVVSDIMWAHPTSIKLFRLFPKVLILDSTYKTNKYNLPLLEIIGVTSTELSFSVAFAYIGHELGINFTWVLHQLRELFVLHGVQPEVFLTDRDLGCMSAIKGIFPSASNLLCSWHVTKNVKAKIKELVHVDRQKEVISLWHNIIDSTEESVYLAQLKFFEDSCADIPSLIKYVHDTWLKPHKERFILAYTNNIPHLGNQTTNRYFC